MVLCYRTVNPWKCDKHKLSPVLYSATAHSYLYYSFKKTTKRLDFINIKLTHTRVTTRKVREDTRCERRGAPFLFLACLSVRVRLQLALSFSQYLSFLVAADCMPMKTSFSVAGSSSATIFWCMPPGPTAMCFVAVVLVARLLRVWPTHL